MQGILSMLNKSYALCSVRRVQEIVQSVNEIPSRMWNGILWMFFVTQKHLCIAHFTPYSERSRQTNCKPYHLPVSRPHCVVVVVRFHVVWYCHVSIKNVWNRYFHQAFSISWSISIDDKVFLMRYHGCISRTGFILIKRRCTHFIARSIRQMVNDLFFLIHKNTWKSVSKIWNDSSWDGYILFFRFLLYIPFDLTIYFLFFF